MPAVGSSKKTRNLPIAQIFSQASSFAIERSARRLRNRLRFDRWLASTNGYLHQAPKMIRKQFGRRRTTPLVHSVGTLEASHLSEYIAASAILHCADGWAYLGRAMAAQLRGDSGTARHLGYYAELRAAASLLAAQGVGVFAGPHALVRESGDVVLFKQHGTHQFAWDALSKWTDLSSSVDLFGEVIQPADAPLSNWLEPLSGGPVWRATGREYLRSWGLDVERFGRDRAARNDSSYQPRTFFGASPPPSARAAAFGSDLWRLFEPDGSTKFGLLDRYLLRRTVRRMYRTKNGKSPDLNPDDFLEYIEPSVDTVQASESRTQLISFLTSESFPDEPPLFAEAGEDSNLDHPEDHLQVIARAALLLRVASGGARQLLRQAELSYPEYEWWSRQIAAKRSLAYEDDELLRTPELLWDDIDVAITDLDQKIDDGDAETYDGMSEDCSRELSLLGGCERIALWGLAA